MSLLRIEANLGPTLHARRCASAVAGRLVASNTRMWRKDQIDFDYPVYRFNQCIVRGRNRVGRSQAPKPQGCGPATAGLGTGAFGVTGRTVSLASPGVVLAHGPSLLPDPAATAAAAAFIWARVAASSGSV